MKNLKQTLRLALLTLAMLLPGVALAQFNFTAISGPSENDLVWTGQNVALLIGESFSVYRGTSENMDDMSELADNIPFNFVGTNLNTFNTYTDTNVTPGVEYYYLVVVLVNDDPDTPSPLLPAIPLSDGGYYAFTNGWSGLALSSGNGGTVQQSYSGTNQLWQLVSEGGGYFAIVNASNNLALSGTTANAQLTLGSYTGATNQLWYSKVANGSDYNIYNASTGQVLDDFGASLANGNTVGQWGTDGASNQLWAAVQAGPPGLTAALNNNDTTTQYTFSGQVSPNGAATTVICSLGTNTNYSVSVTNVFPASFTPTSFSFTVTYPVDNAALQASVTASSVLGSTNCDLTFVIGAPRIQSPGINVTSVLQASVSGQVNPNHLATTVVMQFGTTTAYGQSVTNTLNADGSNESLSGTFTYPDQNIGTALHGFITASNAVGTTTSGDFTFTVGPTLVQSADLNVPSVLTANVSELINPNGFPTTVYVIFAPSGGGNQMANFAISSNNIYQAIANQFNYSSLAGTTNLQVRIAAVNVEGGTNFYLNLPVGAPLIQSPALNVASVQQATASAQVSPNGFPTTVIIEYGTSTAYGQSVTNTLGTDNVYQGVANTFAFPSMAGATTLHARIIASNIVGTTTSDDLTLAVGPPLIQSAALNVASVLQATASGQVNPNGFPTTVIMQFGPTTAYGQSVTNTLGTDNVYQGVANTFAFPSLTGATTLHAMITAINAGGTTTSGDLTFPVGPPLMQAATAASQGESPQAYVSGQINPNGLPTTVVLQFGTNTAYGQAVTNTLGTDNLYQLASATFPELSYNVAVTLHALITASNSAGTVSSGDLPFSSLLFQETYGSDLTGINGLSGLTGSAVWLDFDNDGWLDLAVVGQFAISLPESWICYNPGTNQTTWARNEYVPDGNRAAVAVGDFDNDNRPDLFYACGPALGYGSPYDNYVNFPYPNGVFGGLSGILYGSDMKWTSDIGIITNSSFVTNLNVQDASVVVGDFDHTGRQDALVTGNFASTYLPNVTNGPGAFSILLQNNLAGGRNKNNSSLLNRSNNLAMLPVNTSIPYVGGNDPFEFSSGQAVLAAGDFDNDGFPDLFALNFAIDSTASPYAGFFHGDGNKNFIPTSNFPLHSGGYEWAVVETASCVLADLNGDGYLDMVLSYGNAVYPDEFIDISQTTVSIWLNDGHGNLTNSGIVLPQLQMANLAVGDIFNHGRNDILMVGNTDEGANAMQTVVLRNDGGGVFTPIVLGNYGSIGETGHGLQLADYDNDGRLDFAMTGDTEPINPDLNDECAAFAPATYIFHNQMNIPSNAPPAAPPILGTTVGNGTVTFHWGNATDDITPANLLTYNLRVGTNSLDTSVVSPLANVTTGWRKIVAPGNCGHTTNILYRFAPGTYYWSVQAVDGGFKGGAWAPEQTFTITNPEPAVLALNQPTNQPYVTPYGFQFVPQELTELNASSNLLNVTSNTWNVSWPTRFNGYTLEQSTNLNGLWNTNTPPIGTLNGEYSVLVTNSGSSTYFRLVK